MPEYARPVMFGAACIKTLVLCAQVRMLLASELPALHRFNSSLLESYVEVSQLYQSLHLGAHCILRINISLQGSSSDLSSASNCLF